MNFKTKQTFIQKLMNNFLVVAKAESEMNTVVRETGDTIDKGKAVKLDNHVREVYAREVEFKAMPIMRFLQFAKEKTELGVQPGLSIQMLTYNNLRRGAKLTEGNRMKTQGLTSTMKEIRVHEYGNAVSVSQLALVASFTNTMQDAVALLSRDYALTLDCEFRDTVLAGVTNTIYGRKDKSVDKITSRAEIDVKDHVLSVTSIKDAVEILATSNTPKFDGSHYVAFVHPHQSRDLRDDPEWVNASKYGAPEQLFTGEIGRIDDVRFIETTLMTNGNVAEDDPAYDADLKGTGKESANVFKAVVFGEDTYGYAVALPIEIRDDGITDFGREHNIAWYGIFGTGILHGERGVVIETA